MKTETFEFVDTSALRIGLFVDLDVSWMAHPFPTGSFKISTDKQIDALRGLGLERIRCRPDRSDPLNASADGLVIDKPAPSKSTSSDAQARERQRNAERGQKARQQRAALLGEQQRSLIECERQYGVAAQHYKKTIEQVGSKPQLAAQQCATLVQGLVGEMLKEGETAIRLLTEASGDKTSMHPVNVTVISLLLGKAMGLPAPALHELGVASFLHDIGKCQMPERVRWMEDNFSSAEYKLYQDHVGQSVDLAKSMGLSSAAMLAIAQHHELADGSGFPLKLKGDGISLGARILSLVNRYDNLCNPSRPSSAMTPHEALAMIFAQLKTRFDDVALSAFIRMMGVYPPGSVVQLNDERYGLVVSVNSSRPLKPKVIVHEAGVPKYEALILDLETVSAVSIKRSLKPAKLPSATLEYLAPRQRICYYFEQAHQATVLQTEP